MFDTSWFVRTVVSYDRRKASKKCQRAGDVNRISRMDRIEGDVNRISRMDRIEGMLTG